MATSSTDLISNTDLISKWTREFVMASLELGERISFVLSQVMKELRADTLNRERYYAVSAGVSRSSWFLMGEKQLQKMWENILTYLDEHVDFLKTVYMVSWGVGYTIFEVMICEFLKEKFRSSGKDSSKLKIYPIAIDPNMTPSTVHKDTDFYYTFNDFNYNMEEEKERDERQIIFLCLFPPLGKHDKGALGEDIKLLQHGDICLFLTACDELSENPNVTTQLPSSSQKHELFSFSISSFVVADFSYNVWGDDWVYPVLDCFLLGPLEKKS